MNSRSRLPRLGSGGQRALALGLALPMALLLTAGRSTPPPESARASPVPTAPAEVTTDSRPAALRREMVAAAMRDAGPEHRVRASAGGPEVRHPEMPLAARFETAGVRLWDGQTQSAWSTRLRVSSVGRQGRMQRLAHAKADVDENRVTYRREGSTEWYLHGPPGLEQGLVVHERPLGDGPLIAEVRFEGLRPAVRGSKVVLVDATGVERLVVSDLFATDARGTLLPARFQLRAGSLRYVVDDRHAPYPLEIDPIVQAALHASDAVEESVFGDSVAISGDTILVGDRIRNRAYTFVRSESSWAEQAVLEPPEVTDDARFGRGVALSGDTAIVGDSGRDRAYVYVRTGASWSEQATLEPSDPEQALFGYAVALDADTAVIGRPSRGEVHVFVRSEGSWTEQARLMAPEGADFFGGSVALEGDTVVVGAPGGAGTRTRPGSAHTFLRDGTSWAAGPTLSSAANVDPEAGFGYSVGLYGDTAVVGAPGEDNGGRAGGRAYVFARMDGSWAEQARLDSDCCFNGFGRSVAVNQDLIVVGAPSSDLTGRHEGRAHLFTRTGSSWMERPCPGPDRDSDANYGESVALEGNTIVVGSPGATHSGLQSAGSAYVIAVRAYADGDSCRYPIECASGHCVDGVCCNSECAGGLRDCEACSVEAGASVDGTCSPVPAGHVCRASTSPCDVEEVCDGTATDCPTDVDPEPCDAGADVDRDSGTPMGGDAAPGAGGDGGCGCRMASTARSNPVVPASFLFAALLLRRGRRPRRSSG